MIEFSHCCCCVPLRTGCLILGYLQLIESIIAAVAVIIVVALGAEATSNTQVNESAGTPLIAVFVVALILVTVLLTFSLLLVIGIHKDRRSYVKAYLIYYLIFIVLYAIMVVVYCATSPLNVAVIIGSLIQIMLGVYYLLVIRSYWVTMGDNLNRAV